MNRPYRQKSRPLKWICLAALLLLAVGLYFLWPKSLTFDSDRLELLVMEESVTVENFAALPAGETRSVTLTADSPEFAALWSELDRLRYVPCLHTITGSAPAGVEGVRYSLRSEEGRIYLLEDGAHLWTDNRYYRILVPENLPTLLQEAAKGQP